MYTHVLLYMTLKPEHEHEHVMQEWNDPLGEKHLIFEIGKYFAFDIHQV